MPKLTASELNDLHEELQRLLTIGQPPIIAVILRQRFLTVTDDLGGPVWVGYGFPVALAMARQIVTFRLDGVPTSELTAIEEVLRRTEGLAAPPWPGASEWLDARTKALSAIGEALSRRSYPSRHETSAVSDGHAEILIPVVAELVDGGQTDPLFADLRIGQVLQLRVEAAVVEGSAGGPQLSLDGDTAPATRAAFQGILNHVGRLRAWGAPPATRCHFRVHWDTPGGRLVGCSAGLGFLLAAAAARASMSAGPKPRQLMSGLAATGDIEGTRVQSVDPETLAHKVRACVDSGVSVLLVPKDQEQAALREVNRLAESSPGRALRVIGAEDAAEIWRARTVVKRRSRSAGESWTAWIHWFLRSRLRIALLAVVFLMLVGAGVREAVVSQKNPIDTVWEAEDLVLKNRYGRTWHVPSLFAPDPSGLTSPRDGWSTLLTDLDGDGNNDVLVIHCTPSRERILLTAFEGNGHKLWTCRSVDLGSTTEPNLSDVTYYSLQPLSMSPEGRSQVLTIRRSRQGSLTLVDRFDGATGNQLGHLRNNGHLESLYRGDFNLDGREELALVGTDRIHGLVVFVDPTRMKIPAQGANLEDIPSMIEPPALQAGVVAAWRFSNDRYSPLERATCWTVTREGEQTMVSVEGDGFAKVVLYYFSAADLQRPSLQSVRMNDSYRTAIRNMRAAPTDGVRDNTEFSREEQRLAREVQTLTGSGWVTVLPSIDFSSEKGRKGH